MGSARINERERKKKEKQARRGNKRKVFAALRVKHLIPFRANDALIGDEEQNRKQKKQKSGALNAAQGSYGELILL